MILLSVYDDEQYLSRPCAGASGYLLKGISSDELVRQLERVHAGMTAIDAGLAARAADGGPSAKRPVLPGARQG